MPKTENFKDLIIGANSEEGKGPIYISDSSRKSSVMIIGTKNSGKSQYVIPVLIRQDLEQKDAGMTIIVSQKDAAYNIYAMAKKKKRKVILLKPEVNFEIINDFLWAEEWDYNYVNDFLINYKQAIRDKAVIIIDMEYSRYRMNATRAVSMLLLQLQADMTETTTTLSRRHFVYIDDAHKYLPFIEQLLYEGDTYNISTTLFIQGRNQLTNYEKDYSAIIDNNVRNIILMPGINYEDTKYYGEKLCPIDKSVKEFTHELLMRKYGEFVYEIVGSDYEKYIGKGKLLGLSEDEMEAIYKSAVKFRKKLRVEFKNETIARRLRMQEEAISLGKLPNIEKPQELKETSKTILEEIANENDEQEPIVENVQDELEAVDEIDEEPVDDKKPKKAEKKESKKPKQLSEKESEAALLEILSDSDMSSDFESFDDFPEEEDIEEADINFEINDEGYDANQDNDNEDVAETEGAEEVKQEINESNGDTFEEGEEEVKNEENKKDEKAKRPKKEKDTLYDDFEIFVDAVPEIRPERQSFRPIRINEQMHIISAQDQFNKELRDKLGN